MSQQKLKGATVMISGEAGQGLQTLELLALDVFRLSGYHVYSYSEFMSRIRGGNNSTEIRISSTPVRSYSKSIDIFIPLEKTAMTRFKDRITEQTYILGDMDIIPANQFEREFRIINAPITLMAKDSGGPAVMNMVVLGILGGIFATGFDNIRSSLEKLYSIEKKERLAASIEAALKGYETGTSIIETKPLKDSVIPSSEVKNSIIMNGVDSLGIGALAGGCNFVSSYPMSPSTGVLVFFARLAREFGIVVEQAEDEISAVNMALGAWYAGGRALVTTSGGGFSLMVEGLSLCGAIESPLVVHLGQRPGPATGMPTRTEQADLEHALYSGHGEFPRVILSPGTMEEAFILTRHAFYIADKYQVPVIILTDQQLLESSCDVTEFEINDMVINNNIIETGNDYHRYQFVEGGVSPRGIPGFGKGIVCLDSDEHDEGGYITEDMFVRKAMVDKRLNKFKGLESEIFPPNMTGSENYKYLIVGWGSTRNVVLEAMDILNRDDMAFLHFPQVYPLCARTRKRLERAHKRIIIENNATSQLGKLIKLKTGIGFEDSILKYDGLPFMLEDVVERLEAFTAIN
jgi:2-oxoglutarate/2-oxoacid ferredoxin oxidoreductase subunit alpha